MRAMMLLLLLLLLPVAVQARAQATLCTAGHAFEDRNGNGVRDRGEPGLAGIRVSDGSAIAVSGADGRYALPWEAGGRTIFVIKPAGFAAPRRGNGLPDVWRAPAAGAKRAAPACPEIGLRRHEVAANPLHVLVFADPQPRTLRDVEFYRRDIVAPLLGQPRAELGLTLGDIVNDDLSLYPAMNRVTASLGVAWLHVAGNHDVDRGPDQDVVRDEDALATFHRTYGPDTFAWEEPQASFVLLDDVISLPERKPAYIGGLRQDQFAFLERYLATARKDRLLVIAVHIPFFEPDGQDTFRDADRARLFALLRPFPKVLLLSAHSHTQRQVLHGAATGWHGASPLREYNVGAACGAYWSGVADAQGIPASTMADGTPNGYAMLTVQGAGDYALAWHAARGQGGDGIGLHAPRLLRRGAYPAWGVYANVSMGQDDSRVEVRIDDGEWKPMARVAQPDPALLAENMRDDDAQALRGYDRSPEAEPSTHLWRAALPTDLAAGAHRIEVRAFDEWRGELRAATSYTLAEAVE